MQGSNINDSKTLATLHAVVAPVCEAHGVELVDARFTFEGGRVLQVLIERPGADPAQGAGVTLADCTAVSRALSARFDADDSVLPPGAYRLEVGSPGLERPLIALTDFARFTGREAKVELRAPITGRRRFSGKLLGVHGERIEIEQDGSPIELPHGQITHAHLVHRF